MGRCIWSGGVFCAVDLGCGLSFAADLAETHIWQSPEIAGQSVWKISCTDHIKSRNLGQNAADRQGALRLGDGTIGFDQPRELIGLIGADGDALFDNVEGRARVIANVSGKRAVRHAVKDIVAFRGGRSLERPGGIKKQAFAAVDQQAGMGARSAARADDGVKAEFGRPAGIVSIFLDGMIGGPDGVCRACATCEDRKGKGDKCDEAHLVQELKIARKIRTAMQRIETFFTQVTNPAKVSSCVVTSISPCLCSDMFCDSVKIFA